MVSAFSCAWVMPHSASCSEAAVLLLVEPAPVRLQLSCASVSTTGDLTTEHTCCGCMCCQRIPCSARALRGRPACLCAGPPHKYMAHDDQVDAPSRDASFSTDEEKRVAQAESRNTAQTPMPPSVDEESPAALPDAKLAGSAAPPVTPAAAAVAASPFALAQAAPTPDAQAANDAYIQGGIPAVHLRYLPADAATYDCCMLALKTLLTCLLLLYTPSSAKFAMASAPFQPVATRDQPCNLPYMQVDDLRRSSAGATSTAAGAGPAALPNTGGAAAGAKVASSKAGGSNASPSDAGSPASLRPVSLRHHKCACHAAALSTVCMTRITPSTMQGSYPCGNPDQV